jgi:hypothetical protein
MAFVGSPDLFSYKLEIDQVHISVTFSWDIPEAARLEKDWRNVAPVKMGGPALGQRGEEFTPGQYLKKGYVITSRGCPNRCWFCGVWRREGDVVRELPITDGWNVLDDNLLACSDAHIRSVFAMLARQGQRPYFTGGLEAARLKDWHIDELKKLNPKEMFFAYDGPEDREPLHEAGKLLKQAGFKTCHPLRAYVLVGYRGDTFEAAEKRLIDCIKAGFLPMAMLYRDETGERDPDWIRFTWPWVRPAAIFSKYKLIQEQGNE